jgi:CubicO group peptidase (beta-lactamase class C family)
MYKLTQLLAALAVQHAAANCPAYPFLTTVPLPSPLPQALVDALAAANETLTAALTPPAMPGFAFAVHYNGQEIAAWGGGVANLSAAEPVPPSPYTGLFRIASNTKIFVSLLAYIFDSLGYFSLDEPLSKYVPLDVPNPFDKMATPITARMLASHSSGLPDSLPGYYDWTNITTEDTLAMLAVTPMQRAPYTMPSYSNLGIALLGHVLAEYVMDKKDIGDLIDSYIIKPLNLTHTGYYYDQKALNEMVPGYDSNADVVPIESLGWAAPCGCMYSTVSDMASLGQILAAGAAGEQIALPLTPGDLRKFFQPLYYSPDGSLLMGTPWEQMAVNNFLVRTKSGTLTGYATKTTIIPELRLSMTFCFNGNFGSWYTGQAVIQNVTNSIATALQSVLAQLQPARNAGPNPSDFVGTYVQADDNTTGANVTLSGGSLFFQMTGDVAPAAMQVVSSLQDTYLLFYNATSSDCEHVIMGDTQVGTPVLFKRDSKGNIKSFETIDFSGKFDKQ